MTDPSELARHVRNALPGRSKAHPNLARALAALNELQAQAEKAKTYELALTAIRLNGEDTSGLARTVLTHPMFATGKIEGDTLHWQDKDGTKHSGPFVTPDDPRYCDEAADSGHSSSHGLDSR